MMRHIEFQRGRTRAMFALLLLVAFGVLPARSDGTSPDTETTRAYEEGVVLVRFAPVLRGMMADFVAARHGATIERRNLALDYARLRLGPNVSVPDALASLRRDPTVVWAEANGYYTALGVHDIPQDPMLLPLEDKDPATGHNQWGVFLAGVPWLWRQGGIPGEGVTVAVIDTGIDSFTSPHADLAANIHPTGKDFVDDDTNPTDVGAGAALYGHGTHVAGIVAAASNALGVAGVAYGAKVMVVRVLDCTAGNKCPGSHEDIASGIQFAADNGAKVINLSLGGSALVPLVRSAVQYAIGKGSILVAAAGNDSLGTLSYPARYPEVIAVGATDSLDHVPVFSNYGENLDVVAPGKYIWSTMPGGIYKRNTGTSMASPFVAGVVAILAGRNPAIKALEAEAYLRAHAIPLEGADADHDGYGRVGFMPLEDWDDLPAPYPEARHKFFGWEWLGRDASAELSFSDPFDTDFRPNIGDSHDCDGYDDGAFPGSFVHLPFLPMHIGAPMSTLDVGLSVSRFDGPRYGAEFEKRLFFDAWFDWDSDETFEEGASGEHAIVGHTENPATWGSNSKLLSLPFAPVDEHLLGNPLNIRTRLSYGSPVASPSAEAKHGEVEDFSVVNFIEDFDAAPVYGPLGTGIYTITDGWSVGGDPDPWCSHHGFGGLASSSHPVIGDPCNGFIERESFIGTPMMDWTEYTRATLSFWRCHAAFACSPIADMCRIYIVINGVETDLGPIPIGSGTMEIDLSSFVGNDSVHVGFLENTDRNGYLRVDDVTVTAYDAERPRLIAGLSAVRFSGEKRVNMTTFAPLENDITTSPPAEGTANVYDLRYATSPITSEAAWESALRFDPRDISTGSASIRPVAAATEQSFSATGPSAFQPYRFAIRTQDEVTSLSLLSNSPGVSNTPTLGTAVVPPAGGGLGLAGDSVMTGWGVANTGNTPDSYAITAVSARGWELIDIPSLVTLDAGLEEDFELRVVIPVSASGGEQDTVTLTATSLADISVSASAFTTITVEGTPPSSVDGIALGIQADDLRVVSGNPVRSALTLELDLVARGPVAVHIFTPGGRLVRTLLDETKDAGRHRLSWDARDDGATRVASGMYFLDARMGKDHIARRLIVLR